MRRSLTLHSNEQRRSTTFASDLLHNFHPAFHSLKGRWYETVLRPDDSQTIWSIAAKADWPVLPQQDGPCPLKVIVAFPPSTSTNI